MVDNHPDQPHAPINPTALSMRDTAQLLSKAGGRLVTEEMLRDDVDAGAPTNPDGTINLVHYTAWLVMEMSGTAGSKYGD